MTVNDDLGRFQRRRRVALAGLIAVIFISLLFVGTSTRMPESFHEHVEQVGIVLIVAAILGACGARSTSAVARAPRSSAAVPIRSPATRSTCFRPVGAAGIGAMSGSITVAVAFAIITAAAFHYVIRVEEEYLEQAFGENLPRLHGEGAPLLSRPRLFRERTTC